MSDREQAIEAALLRNHALGMAAQARRDERAAVAEEIAQAIEASHDGACWHFRITGSVERTDCGCREHAAIARRIGGTQTPPAAAADSPAARPMTRAAGGHA